MRHAVFAWPTFFHAYQSLGTFATPSALNKSEGDFPILPLEAVLLSVIQASYAMCFSLSLWVPGLRRIFISWGADIPREFPSFYI
jgi:hypothetical protein